MRFSETELADLEIAQEMCQRPLQCLGKPMGHEDIKRTADGLPIIDLDGRTKYFPECMSTEQHLGCPHFLAREKGFLNRMIAVLTNDPSKKEYFGTELNQTKTAASVLDVRMREARTGISTGDDFFTESVVIPDANTAASNAAPIEREFQEFCQRDVEPLRARLLELIETALLQK